jgi:hypothetical protein
MSRKILLMTFAIGVGGAVNASGQHPATVFPGTPLMPGLSAPVAFPGSQDPRTVARPAPVTANTRTSSEWEPQVAARSMERRLRTDRHSNRELTQELPQPTAPASNSWLDLDRCPAEGDLKMQMAAPR